jgi:hypothetical protein
MGRNPDSGNALEFGRGVAYSGLMRRHNVTLSEPVSETIEAQVKSGRYKDFSAAVQDAAWNYFFGPPSPFDEYDVTPAEVERAAQHDLAEIRRDRKAGRLKPWKP